jgi:hypothetical protein
MPAKTVAYFKKQNEKDISNETVKYKASKA